MKGSSERAKSNSLSIVQNLANASSNALNSDLQIAQAQGASESESLRIENQTKIFASMCPDEILDYYDNYETRSYHTTLMLGDVSGFTEMTEKYTQSGKGGPSKLTDSLNSYIGAMVQEILSHNGDVLKFSGDAFIVMWKLEDSRVMRDIANEAIRTACIIQKHFGTYETEVDVVLKVKLAIASGKIFFTSIGDAETASYYIITGKPVWEVKYAEGLCRGGDILVAQSCWQWVNPNEYIFEALPDGVHTLIISLSVLWDNMKDSYSNDVSKDSSRSSDSTVYSNVASDDSSETDRDSTTSIFYHKLDKPETTDYSLRPKVIKAAKSKLNKELRNYMLRPVIRSVEMDEPLEYLTEIRQVVIVFVNVITRAVNRKTLIKLVNAAFLFVCSIVGDMQGCVNKTSLFDKDLIFLCIFGLRGDKHELESQIGLRCASKLRRGLLRFQNVQSVTVGMTTGMTYCGVVGHVLRREYTVIGMAVNKAARLMCTYVDKVVCDRESFLLSHLEAKHFILQEAKLLKGISSVGPVYEFSEQSEPSVHDLSVNRNPILGRDTELKLFHNMLNDLLESFQNEDEGENNDDSMKSNILIIKGEPRMGKTRLLEEMSNIAPGYVPMNFISLAVNDKQFPFVLLRLLFYVPMGITQETPLKQKQEKIADHFPNKDSWRLCALNQVFNVNFKISLDYYKLDQKMRRKHLKKLLARLTRRCFFELWVIIIDDAELADDESLSLFHIVSRQKTALLVLSYGNKLSKDYAIPDHITRNAQIIELAGLDKWYHAAFACHVMDVVAIPAELEKVIQERSSGNPGWIESYLISLLQSTGLVLKNLTKMQIHNMGLVSPARNLLTRTSDAPLYEIPSDPSITSYKNRWKMYQSSFRESFPINEDDRENGNGEFDDIINYNVCTLTSNFVLEDVDTEATMNTILLKLYDSLTPLDQFLLKCAAVLGEIVDRKMLEKLMQGTPQRDIGISLVKLFELRIIGCAVGDFSRSPEPALNFKRIDDPTLKAQVRCGCKGIEIPQALDDLPHYAACGLMRFKLDMFRETTYRLLTENQKVEFHSKALRYLQQHTRRCASCGGGQFNKLLGETAMSEIGKKKMTDELTTELRLSTGSKPKSTGGSNTEIDENDSCSGSSLSLFKMCTPITRSPTRTFSNADFTNCECNSHLLTAYTHVMEHCRGIGVNELLLVAILEFIEVCISTLNIPLATKLINEGEGIIDSIYNSAEDELIVYPYLKGKIQTLRGRCFLENGLLAEAMKCFESTTKIMGYSFPNNPVLIRLKSFCLLKQQELMLTCMRHFKVGALDGDAANYNDQFASTLGQMFIVYRMTGKHEHAKLAAIWALNVALASNKDFFVLCTSYANMMITSHDNQFKSIIPYLETDAINLCDQRKESIELQELNAVAQLYTRIFFSRWIRGMTEKATSIGFIAAKQAHAIRSVSLKLTILPRLVQLLMTQCRIGEVVSIIRELEFVLQNDLDQSGKTWYFALSVDLLLESGISILTLAECEEFYQHEGFKIMNLRDDKAAKRFFINVWLWYVRIGNWEVATVWRTRKYGSLVSECSVVSGITALKKLEGLIICYVIKLDNKNSIDATTIHSDIKETFKIARNILKVVKTVMPRYLLMKAYYEMVMLRRKYGLALLQKSKKLATELGNILIYNWADHCEKSWTGSLSLIQQEFWKEQCTIDKQIDWHEVDLQNRKILPYTLPLPKIHQWL